VEFIADHSDAILLLASISLAAFIVSLLFLPLIMIALPRDFFVRGPFVPVHLSPLRLCLKVVKNMIGGLFLTAGFVMLFIPGQGLLTLLLGISLMDFPGKRMLEIRIVRSPKVHRSLNWLRAKANRPPFELP
jgi:hypothetical protein